MTLRLLPLRGASMLCAAVLLASCAGTRISIEPSVPKACTWTSPMFSSFSAVRTSEASPTPSLALTSIIEPPVKSMP